MKEHKTLTTAPFSLLDPPVKNNFKQDMHKLRIKASYDLIDYRSWIFLIGVIENITHRNSFTSRFRFGNFRI